MNVISVILCSDEVSLKVSIQLNPAKPKKEGKIKPFGIFEASFIQTEAYLQPIKARETEWFDLSQIFCVAVWVMG